MPSCLGSSRAFGFLPLSAILELRRQRKHRNLSTSFFFLAYGPLCGKSWNKPSTFSQLSCHFAKILGCWQYCKSLTDYLLLRHHGIPDDGIHDIIYGFFQHACGLVGGRLFDRVLQCYCTFRITFYQPSLLIDEKLQQPLIT